MENTIVYLIRHSVRFNNERITQCNSSQKTLIKNEKSILSVEGEKRAKILSKERELQNIDIVYVSNCVRTLQTAKYLLENQNLFANIDDRFDERRVEEGETEEEVIERFTQAFNEKISENKGKRIAVFSHGYAIVYFLKTWCKTEYNREEERLKLVFNNNVIFNKKINAPEVFKLEFDKNNNIIDIINIEFKVLPYRNTN